MPHESTIVGVLPERPRGQVADNQWEVDAMVNCPPWTMEPHEYTTFGM